MVDATQTSRVEATVEVVRGLVAGLDPDRVTPAEASRQWRAFDTITRLAGAAKVLLARRVEDAAAWKNEGCRSAAEHLARISGGSVHGAREALRASKKLRDIPVVEAALREGRLSVAQAQLLADAAAVAPDKQTELLDAARRLSLAELAQECGRVKATADPDPEATYRRIRANRRLRQRTDSEGAWCLFGRGTPDDGALFQHTLEPLIDQLYDQARRHGRHEHRDTYTYDALIQLLHRHLATETDTDDGSNRDDATPLRDDADDSDADVDPPGGRGGEGDANPHTDRAGNPDADPLNDRDGQDGGNPHTDRNADADADPLNDRSGEVDADPGVDRGGDQADRNAGAGNHGDPETVATDPRSSPTTTATAAPPTLPDGRPRPRPHPPGPPTPTPPRRRRRSRSNPRYLALLRIDVSALQRGRPSDGELCEIAGIGPVPISVARRLLGDAIVKLVITRGADVVNVTSLGRGPTAAQRVALLWQSPTCANQACARSFVQIDHRQPWATNHRTQLPNLDPLCPHCHRLKTHHNWALVDGTGKRAFVPPADPRHPDATRHERRAA